MSLKKFLPLVFFLYIFSSTSCSRPKIQILAPLEIEHVPEKKKTSLDAADKLSGPLNDDTGIFDDESFQLNTNEKLWRLISDLDGIKTYERQKLDSNTVIFRGEVIIPALLKKVATILEDSELQKLWVDSYIDSKTLVEVSDLERIVHSKIKTPWPCQNRDFVFKVNIKSNVQPPTLLIAMKSINHSSAPPVDDYVRGEIIDSYYYLKEISGLRATKIVVEVEVDPKGAIPLWLVKRSQKDWPYNTLMALKKISLREDIRVLPKIEKLFEEIKVKAKTNKGNKK